MALRRLHFLNPMIHSQSHTLKGWAGHRLVKIGLATRPSIAKWQFQKSFLFFLGVWVKLVALQHHGIDPNMSNSGHHGCSTQAVFLCTADKLQSCHMLAHWTHHTGPSPPFNQHSFSFSCSMKFFLGLALGESCAACTTTEKHWCPPRHQHLLVGDPSNSVG